MQTFKCFSSELLAFSFLHSELNRRAHLVKNVPAKIELLGSYDPQKQLIIKDPYYVSIQVNSPVEYLRFLNVLSYHFGTMY